MTLERYERSATGIQERQQSDRDDGSLYNATKRQPFCTNCSIDAVPNNDHYTTTEKFVNAKYSSPIHDTHFNISSLRHLASISLPYQHAQPPTSQHPHKHPKDASVQFQNPFLGEKYRKSEQRIRKEYTRNKLARNSCYCPIKAQESHSKQNIDHDWLERLTTWKGSLKAVDLSGSLHEHQALAWSEVK